MQSIIFPLLISLIAGLSTLIGVIFIYFKIKRENLNKFICFCLSFSISIMILISILDLIPVSFYKISSIFGVGKGTFILFVAFLISYITITTLDFIIKNKEGSEELYKLGILNMIVLILHNFPEGIATFLSSYQNTSLGLKLSLAIMLHNIPEGIAIAVPIYYGTQSKRKAIYATLISGLSEPIGALLAFILLKNYVSDLMISITLIIVAGLMITLSIQQMLPKALRYKENKLIYIGFLLGIIVILVNIFIS